MSKQSAQRVLALVAGAMADALQRRGTPVAAAAPPPAKPKVYIADNSRLRPTAHHDRDRIEALCERYGLTAHWPPEHFLFPTGSTVAERSAAGFPPEDKRRGELLRKAWCLLGECDAVIAELSPFRGPHCNPIVGFEIGVAVVHEIPIFGWTNATYPALPPAPRSARRPRLLDDRVWSGAEVSPDGHWRDEDGNLVENFDLVEYAQIAGNLAAMATERSAAIATAARYFDRQRSVQP